MSDRHATAASLGMQSPTDETHARCRAAADHIMALMPGFSVQEASSILCLCMGEIIGLMPRHDVPKALRQVLPAIAAHVAANPPGALRWAQVIRPEDVTP